MMSSSSYGIRLQRLKPVHTAYVLLMWPAQFGQKLVLGTRRNWLRPRYWQFFSRRGVGTPWDRDHNPAFTFGADSWAAQC